MSHRKTPFLFGLFFLFWGGAVVAQEAPGLAAPVGLEAISDASEYDDLVWIDRSSTLLNTGVSAIAIPSDQPDTVYVGGRGFVAKSIDGGITWTSTLSLAGASFQTTDDGRVEVHSDIEVFDDSDALDTYEETREELYDELEALYGEDYATQLILDMDEDLREEAFADMVDQANASADRSSFQERLQELRSAGFSTEESARLATDPMETWELVAPDDLPGSVYLATGSGLFFSPDYAQSWEQLYWGYGPEGTAGVLSVAVEKSGQEIAIGTTAGFKLSEDGGRTWQTVMGSLSSEPIREVEGTTFTGRYYALALDALYRTDDHGITWSTLRPTGFDASQVQRIISPRGWSDTLLAVCNDGVYRSDDGGESWIAVATAEIGSASLTSLTMPTGDPDTFILSSAGDVYVSIDEGETWRRESEGLIGQDIYRIAVKPNGELWLATSTGVMVGVSGQEALAQKQTYDSLERIWGNEPSPGEVIWAAMVYNDQEEIPTDMWQTQLWLARLGPRVSLNMVFQQRIQDNEYVNWTMPDSDTLATSEYLDARRLWWIGEGVKPRDYFRWEVFAMWDIGRMIFDSAEVQISAAGLELRRVRSRLATRVVRTLMRRRSVQLRAALLPEVSAEEEIGLLLELEELTALLDGYTGGYFTTTIDARSKTFSELNSFENIEPLADSHQQ